MQKKHLIAFTMATIFLLLGFNIINGKRHEQSRAAPIENTAPIATETSTATDVNDSNTNIAAQPLGAQPKAIIDNATSQIEQAQNIEQQRLEQTDSAAQ